MVRAAYKENRAFSDRFIPEILEIVKHQISPFVIASVEDDCRRATDIISIKAGPIRIAARVRRAEEYLTGDYKHQFTIRSRRDDGVKTELAKILEGWGDYMMYCFAGANESRLCKWTLCDLHIFRQWYEETSAAMGCVPGPEKSNGDGTYFRWYRWDWITERHPKFIIARYPLEIKQGALF